MEAVGAADVVLVDGGGGDGGGHHSGCMLSLPSCFALVGVVGDVVLGLVLLTLLLVVVMVVVLLGMYGGDSDGGP